ncbi:MAG: hypothetical protein ACPL5F_01530 [Moorellaceae bacterium]
MHTVSLLLAQELQAAGLEWKPKPGDWYEDAWGTRTLVVVPERIEVKKDLVWLPTLADLLEWLERKGYGWTLQSPITPGKEIGNEYTCDVDRAGYGYVAFTRAQTAEDAVAKAVLEVLTKEKKGLIINRQRQEAKKNG